MELPKDPNFNHETRDVHGKVPDFGLLSTRLKHTGNQKTYQIVGFAWLGATDEWAVRMIDTGGGPVEVVRPLDHIDGQRDNGEPRYEPA